MYRKYRSRISTKLLLENVNSCHVNYFAIAHLKSCVFVHGLAFGMQRKQELIQTSPLFIRKFSDVVLLLISCYLHMKGSKVCIKTKTNSSLASMERPGQRAHNSIMLYRVFSFT